MSEVLAGTALEAGKVVPGAPVELEPGGDTVRLWDFRQRAAVVLAWLHPGCDRCDEFERRLRDEAGADVHTAGGRLVFVRDGGSTGRRRFLGHAEPPVVVVIDRYGAAWRSYPAPGHEFPDPSEVGATLWHLATMCPECGVSTWT